MFYYITNHTLNVLLHYLANSKLLILLLFKHNKCNCSYLFYTKRGVLQTSYSGPYFWTVLLSGSAVDTEDSPRYQCNFW